MKRSSRTDAGAATAQPPPAPILDDAEQEATIATFMAENARIRSVFGRALAVLYAAVSLGLVALATAQATHPTGSHARLLAPLRESASARGVILLLLAIAGVAALLAAGGGRRVLPVTTCLSLIPAAAAAWMMSRGGLWAQHGLWWVPLAAPGLAALAWAVERTFDRIDDEIGGLVRLRYEQKSA